MLLGVFALLQLIVIGFRVVLSFRSYHDDSLGLSLAAQNAVVGLLIIGTAVMAAALVVAGRDFGRSLGFAVAGYGVLAGFAGLTSQAVFLFHASWDLGDLASIMATLLLTALAVAIFFVLSGRGVADWVAQQRRR